MYLPWCVYVSESCPFGDSQTPINFDDGSTKTCSEISNTLCEQSSSIREKCCVTCPTFLTPWLGPNCEYGDKSTQCVGMSDLQCTVNVQLCCDTCCPVNGPEEGYSCTNPTTVDECTDGTHNCHAQATCTNTDDSFTCTCNSGYAGDGTSCTGEYFVAESVE